MSASRFQFERSLLEKGVTRIAGLDEAGRGPLAGPVVAAAVVLPERWVLGDMPDDLLLLNDSKQLTPRQRENFFAILTDSVDVHHGHAMVSSEVIDSINILQATHRAMNEALSRLSPLPSHTLVDGLRVPSLRIPQTPIVKGDSQSYSIAAASVIAKVTRDRLMHQFDSQYPHYGFAEHKGYGTPKHLAMLAKHGPCPIHRQSFMPVKQAQMEFL